LAEDGLVDLPAGAGVALRDGHDGLLAGDTVRLGGGDELGQLGRRSRRAGRGGGAGHDQGDLVPVPSDCPYQSAQDAERVPPYLLMVLGQLATDRAGRSAPNAAAASPVSRPAGAAPRTGRASAPRRPSAATGTGARQAAGAGSPRNRPVAGQSRHGQRRGSTADGPGCRRHRQPGVQGRPDQPETGVGDRRHAAIGHQDDSGARARGLHQLGRTPALIGFEVGHDPAGDGHPEVAGQPQQPPGGPRPPRCRPPRARRGAGLRRRRRCPAAHREGPPHPGRDPSPSPRTSSQHTPIDAARLPVSDGYRRQPTIAGGEPGGDRRT